MEQTNVRPNTPTKEEKPYTKLFLPQRIVIDKSPAINRPFKSPVVSRATSSSLAESNQNVEKIKKMREELDVINTEIRGLTDEGLNEGELHEHVTLLHEYNDIKDIGQLLLGKLAEVHGVTVQEMYERFGLDEHD